jgi:CBS domain-containing protein
MQKITNLLSAKSGEIWSIGPDDSVYDAIKLMAAKGIGALLVTDDGTMCGIISERDYARKIILVDRSSKTTPVKDIMTSRVYYVDPRQTVHECMALMTEKRIRHLPVLDDGKLVGVVSIGDLVKSIIAEQEFMIEQLEQYIVG